MKLALAKLTTLIFIATAFSSCSGLNIGSADAAKEVNKVKKMRRITEHWSAEVDNSFRSRVDNGSKVFWKPGRTIWIDVYDTQKRESVDQTLKKLKASASKERKDIFDFKDGQIHRFAYLLREVTDGKATDAVYSHSIVPTEYMLMAIYFDKAEDKEWASALAKSAQFQ